MPGLSQLKQFNSDILSLGDEQTIRASRGEKPVKIPIPKEVKDVNDAEDFVLGMPEKEAEIDNSSVDEDLSDLMGLASENKSENTTQEAPSFEAPDLSNLLGPMDGSDGNNTDEGMPDLSMFMDEPEPEEVPVEEEEPEEVSIADMGLDALLSGAGFDGSEGSADNQEKQEEEEPDLSEIDADLKALNEKNAPEGELEPEQMEPVDAIEEVEESEPLSEIEKDLGIDLSGSNPKDEQSINSDNGDALSLDELLGSGPEKTSEEAVSEPLEDIPDAGDFNLDSLDNPDDLGASPTDSLNPEDLSLDSLDNFDEAPAADLNLDDLNETPYAGLNPDDSSETSASELPSDDFNLDSIDIPDIASEPENNSDSAIPPAENNETTAADDFNLNDLDLGSFDETPAADLNLDSLDNLDNQNEASSDDLNPEDFNLDNLDETPAAELNLDDSGEISAAETPSEETPAADFNLDNLDIPDNIPEPEDNAGDEKPSADNFEDAAGNDFNLDNLDLGSLDETAAADLSLNNLDETPAADLNPEDLNLDDISSFNDAGAGTDLSGDLSSPDNNSSDTSLDEGFGSDFSNLDSSDSLDNIDFGSDTTGLDDIPATDGLFDSKNDEIPDYGDDNFTEELDSPDSENGEPETFDTSAMNDIDFGIQDTDSQLGGDSDFDLGNSADIPLEGSDFEIPGFSDVQTAKEEKHAPTKLASSKKQDEEKLPDNTLSDEQYKQFLKNLNEYPLNVRLAFENLIVQDEFTDDAEFEIIEKILNKVPARQLASSLEKMLDTSIPVPRDFEHRTAEEYEAYKKSIQYQLKNRILPALFVGMICVLVGIGIFNFVKNCIYRPLKATSLYKQGYALLQEDEYPQSEMKFNEAVKQRLIKKWFYSYARGYRDHKQYQRAATMYENILRSFNHDKDAGLEYAGMELNDLANYEKAEEIVRREVLDYHINDPDGILMLGDVFLEWGTEKDPEKLPLAREQYATLLQLYKPNDLYYSRMMRYFIRTDNLRQVLQLKSVFDNREKSLSSDDWTELSGYLLDKMYGTISPSEEYLRTQIEGLRALLIRAVKTDPSNPVALYNLSRYYIQTGENAYIESTLKSSIDRFNEAESLKSRDIYKYIDAYRLLGEHYVDSTDYLKAQEQYAEGITLYTAERDNAGFNGNKNIGHLYADLADINYFVSGNYNEAIENYKHAIELDYDNPSIRYRVGYVQYKNKNYGEALGSFMKSGEGSEKDRNLLLAMANTLSLRGDDYAAEGYYNQLIANLDDAIAKKGIVFPQTSEKDYDIVNTYLSAANNYGVTLYRLAKRTGNSDLNAQAIVQFQQSVRAWDALTRNQQTLVRMDGSNLALENIKYITHPYTDFEPAIYIDIPKALTDQEGIN